MRKFRKRSRSNRGQGNETQRPGAAHDGRLASQKVRRPIGDQPVGTALGHLTYRVASVSRSIIKSATSPRRGSLNAIMKFDGVEAPHCLYDEIVATELARTLALPVALGVFVYVERRYAYASIELSPATPKTQLSPKKLRWIASQDRWTVTGIFAFDLLIGNRDRSGNFFEGLVGRRRQLVAFDHSHSLLDLAGTVEESLSHLARGDIIVRNHPFSDLVDPHMLHRWVARIERLSYRDLKRCCLIGHAVGSVRVAMQRDLLKALAKRRRLMRPMLAGLKRIGTAQR